MYVYFLWAPFSQKNLTQKGRRSNNIVLDRSLWELKADSLSTLCCLSGMNQQVMVDGRICSDNQCIGSHLECFFSGDFCPLTLHHSCLLIDFPSFLHNSICQPIDVPMTHSLREAQKLLILIILVYALESTHFAPA